MLEGGRFKFQIKLLIYLFYIDFLRIRHLKLGDLFLTKVGITES